MKESEIPNKRIGDIEFRKCVTSNKYEIVKWCKDPTISSKEYCYVVSFVKIYDDCITIEDIGDSVLKLEPKDRSDYSLLKNFIISAHEQNLTDNHVRQIQEEEGMKNDFADDKLRWDLLPFQEIEDIVRVYHFGAKKYKANSWQNLPDGFERYRGALLRHLSAYMNGERIDGESGLMHLAQVAWNAIALLWYDKHGKGLGTNPL